MLALAKCWCRMFKLNSLYLRCDGESNTSRYKSFDWPICRFGVCGWESVPVAFDCCGISKLSYCISASCASSSCLLSADPLPESYMLFLRRWFSTDELESLGQHPDDTSMHVSVELLFCLINNLTKLNDGFGCGPIDDDDANGCGLSLCDDESIIILHMGNKYCCFFPYESMVELLIASIERFVWLCSICKLGRLLLLRTMQCWILRLTHVLLLPDGYL